MGTKNAGGPNFWWDKKNVGYKFVGTIDFGCPKFVGIAPGTECMRYGKARTPFGIGDITSWGGV